MLATQGGRFGGWGFYLLKGKPVYVWNLLDLKRVRWEGTDTLSPGKHTLEFEFKYDGMGMGTLAFNSTSGLGRSGEGVIKVDGKVVSREKMERTIPLVLQWDESFDVGGDTGTPVDDKHYQVPVQIHRQAQQADAQDRSAEADAGGFEETGDRRAQQQDERVTDFFVLSALRGLERCPI